MILSQSIRWRIQLWHTLLLALIITVLLYAFHRSQREVTYEILDRELTGQVTALLPRFDRGGPGRPERGPRRRPGGPEDFDEDFDELSTNRSRRRGGRPGPDPDDSDAPPGHRLDLEAIEERVAELVTRDIYVIAWGTPEEGIIYQSDNVSTSLSETPPTVEPGFTTLTRDGFREVIHQSPGGGIIISGTSLQPYEQKLANLQFRLIGIGGGLVTLGFLVGSFLIGRSLKPIQGISETAHGIAKGDLSRRIEIHEPDGELGQLSLVLNDTFEKLETSFEHQVRFTADASHEMRTPVAVILAKSQFALSRERTPEKYQEALKTCMDSAQHMRSLIDALLELAKVDSGEFNLHLEDRDLAHLTHEVAELIRPLADERRVKLITNINSAPLSFDPQRMRQALLNLLGNAVKYNREKGEIHLSLTRHEQGITLSIQDTGPGIAKENIPHLFERFYRVDRARTRGKEGGTGLGLAITHAIIQAHGGTIEVESTLDHGTTFKINLPAK
ncbi:ATP-binding protein [Verrucomicrobiaceae bacterium 227]